MPFCVKSLRAGRCPLFYRWFIALPLLLTSIAFGDSVSLEPAKDATLYEQSQGTLASGAGEHLFVGRTGQPENRRAVMVFDLADSIPSTAVITSVSLALNMSRTISGTNSVRLHRVLKDWDEGSSNPSGNEGTGATSTDGDATWIHSSFPDEVWENPGGDFSSSVSVSASVGAEGTYFWSSADMLADVRTWIDDPSTNFGWILLGDESTSRSAKRFDSRETPAVSNRPRLTVTFDVPVENSAPLLGDFDNSGRVDFDDFFPFADHFGTVEASASWDPTYDMTVDGAVDFDDFFAFADAFGSSVSD